MSMPERRGCGGLLPAPGALLAALLLAPPALAADAAGGLDTGAGPALGRVVDAGEVARWDITVFPDGQGLPAGSGTVAEGGRLYAALCAGCHGEAGRGATADELAGGRGALDSPHPDKNFGNYWPHATTLFDWMRRSMPLDAPGSLDANALYALSAYLLHLNALWPAGEPLDAAGLAAVPMPNRAGFLPLWPEDPERLRQALQRAAAARAAAAGQAAQGATSPMDAAWD